MIIERKKTQLAEAGPYLPAGLRKQYEIQLRMLESNQGVDLEMVGAPLVIRPFAEPDGPRFTISSILARPWSRGSIVSVLRDITLPL